MKPADAKQVAEAVVATLLARGLVTGRRSARWVAPDDPSLVPPRLTVAQFAVCVGLCIEVVRRRIRDRFIAREFVFGPPYRIDRAALASFKVPLELAAGRLRCAAFAVAPAELDRRVRAFPVPRATRAPSRPPSPA
jgi:hypothetical protein